MKNCNPDHGHSMNYLDGHVDTVGLLPEGMHGGAVTLRASPIPSGLSHETFVAGMSLNVTATLSLSLVSVFR